MISDLLLILGGIILFLILPFMQKTKEKEFLGSVFHAASLSTVLLVIYLYALSFIGMVNQFTCFFFVAASYVFFFKYPMKIPRPNSDEKKFILAFLLFSSVLLLPFLDKFVYPQDDAKIITLLSRIVIENNGRHETMMPYKNIDSFSYPPGGFLFVSFFHFTLDLRPETLVLYLTPVFTLFFSLGCYYVGSRYFNSRTGLFCGIVSMLGVFPYYASWGWNIYLMFFFLILFMIGKRDNNVLLALTSTALIVTHTVLFLLAALVLVCKIVADHPEGFEIREFLPFALPALALFTINPSGIFEPARLSEVYSGWVLSGFGHYQDLLSVYLNMLELHGVMLLLFIIGIAEAIRRRDRNDTMMLVLLLFSMLSAISLHEFKLKQVVERLLMFSFLPLTMIAGRGIANIVERAGQRIRKDFNLISLSISTPKRRYTFGLKFRKVAVSSVAACLLVPLFFSPFLHVLSEKRFTTIESTTVLSEKDYEAMMWIEDEIEEDAVFLNDGGGVGGWGGGCDAGEWIMPVTGRQVLMSGNFITEAFWIYDLPSRFMVLKEVSKDPDSPESRNLLDAYNITHAYIGERRMAMSRNCLLDFGELNNSSTFSLVYAGPPYIFEVMR